MGRFDTTARRTAKREPVGFFRWTLPRLDPAVTFAGWLDARTAPEPPESELTCDALAEFAVPSRPEEPWILVAEFQTESRNDDLEWLLEYMLRFRRERRPSSDPRLKYLVAGLLLNLTGPRQPDVLAMPLPGMAEFGLGGRVVRMALREEDAAATLARVASGELSRCVLPWVALMRGGGEPAILEEWKRLADLEPDVQVRLQYAADALVFAELPDVWTPWRNALEGWNVRLVSQQVVEWQGEAVILTLRCNISRALEVHCGSPTPADVAFDIQNSAEQEQLWRWFDAALKAKSYDEFRAAMSSQVRSPLPRGWPPQDDRSYSLEFALESWNRRAAQQVLEWQAEALRTALVRLLEKRCKTSVPSDLAETIRMTHDLRRLFQWFDAAAEATTFDDIRAATGA